jgi:hypothetical protein
MKQKRKPSIGYEQAPMRTLIQCGTEVAAAQTEIEETILDYSSVGLYHECHERRLWAACGPLVSCNPAELRLSSERKVGRPAKALTISQNGVANFGVRTPLIYV